MVKNKDYTESHSYIETTLLATLPVWIILFLFLIVYFLFIAPKYSDFKITQDNCHDEEIMNSSFMDFNLNGRTHTLQVFANSSIEFCEHQEVDRIEYNSKCCSNSKDEYAPVFCYGCKKNISKEDLTEEWLEENCICINGVEHCEMINEDTCKVIEGKFDKCRQHKCGNYTVEVL